MRFLMALALLAAAAAFGQTTRTCTNVDPRTFNCRATGSTATLETQQLTSDSATATAQQEPLRQEIEAQRLQTELLQKQIEILRQQLQQQRLRLEAAKDHQMRLERLQRSFVMGAPCLKSNTPDYCAARDPELRAAKDDVASGRISEAEFVQAFEAASKQVEGQAALP